MDYINILGQCSFDTKDNFKKTCKFLSNNNQKYVRVGAWKPRTNFGLFEGYGEKCLKDIYNISKDFGLTPLVEVGTRNHVKLVLKNKINHFWIGAMTATSPFAVSEIADEIKKKDVSILIKNPIAANFNLWVGAIDRIQNSNPKFIGLVFRGIATTEKHSFRNYPFFDWILKIKEKYRYNIWVDPSHIAGDSKKVLEIINMSKNIGIDKFMIEIHPNKKDCLTDKAQAMTLRQAKKLL